MFEQGELNQRTKHVARLSRFLTNTSQRICAGSIVPRIQSSVAVSQSCTVLSIFRVLYKPVIWLGKGPKLQTRCKRTERLALSRLTLFTWRGRWSQTSPTFPPVEIRPPTATCPLSASRSDRSRTDWNSVSVVLPCPPEIPVDGDNRKMGKKMDPHLDLNVCPIWGIWPQRWLICLIYLFKLLLFIYSLIYPFYYVSYCVFPYLFIYRYIIFSPIFLYFSLVILFTYF